MKLKLDLADEKQPLLAQDKAEKKALGKLQDKKSQSTKLAYIRTYELISAKAVEELCELFKTEDMEKGTALLLEVLPSVSSETLTVVKRANAAAREKRRQPNGRCVPSNH